MNKQYCSNVLQIMYITTLQTELKYTYKHIQILRM
jgi:hypothetical protein